MYQTEETVTVVIPRTEWAAWLSEVQDRFAVLGLDIHGDVLHALSVTELVVTLREVSGRSPAQMREVGDGR